MRVGLVGWIVAAGTAVLAVGAQAQEARPADPIRGDEVPRRKVPAPLPARGTYVPPRTPWGDPDITGAYTNSDESGIPLERPDEFAGRRLEDFTPAELAALTEQRQEQTIERNPLLSAFPGATSPMHWFENYFAANSRAWLIADPPDGHVPPMTEEARQRDADRRAARGARGPADSWVDRSLYDRCITRGIPGSGMPAIYGNPYHIQHGRSSCISPTMSPSRRSSTRVTRATTACGTSSRRPERKSGQPPSRSKRRRPDPERRV